MIKVERAVPCRSGSDLDVEIKAAKPHVSYHRCEPHWRMTEGPIHQKSTWPGQRWGGGISQRQAHVCD